MSRIRTDKVYKGKPCPRGHTKRYINNNNCIQCSRDNSAKKYWRNKDTTVDETFAATVRKVYERSQSW